MAKWYRQGTITVTNGSTAVAGATTSWLNQVKQGDLIIFANGTMGEIASDPTVNDALTLQTPYAGTTGAGQSYAIARFSDGWRPTAELALRVANFLTSAVQIYGGNGAPSAGLGGDGSVYFRQDQPLYYTKSGGAWNAPVSLLGPQGPAGAGFSISATGSNAIGVGSKSFTVAAGGTSYLGARMRAAATAAPTNYVEGIVTAATATSVTINADKTGGTGTHTAWSLVTAGDPGSQGAPGSPSTGVSSSPVAIGVGNLTFAVPANLDLVVGQRVRFADSANPTTKWVEGIIATYSGGSMTINVANDGASTAGSGTVSSWTFGIIGSRGATGAASTVAGPAGPAGLSYNATSTSSIAIGTGNKVFTIGTGTAYLPGSRVRVASTADPSTHWMEGECITYTAGNITIAVDTVGTGTGTLASWNLSLAGEPGIAGADGVSVVSAGSYDVGTTYSLGKTVRSGGATWVYINTAAAAGNAPPSFPTESDAYWQLVARDGVDGSGAVDSVNGKVGPVVLDATDIEAVLTPTNYTPAGTSINDHLEAIDEKLASGPNYQETALASAATVDIGAAPTVRVSISGTTTITSLGAVANAFKIVRFLGALTLTHNATSLALPGSANIATAANDVAEFSSDASGNWRCIAYTRANQPPVTADGKFTLNRASASAESFEFLARTSIGYPVPYLRPTTANTRCAFDISPNGSPSVGAGLVAWFDVVNADLTATANLNAARVGITADKVVFGSVEFGTASVLPVEMQVGGDAVARWTANSYMVGKSASSPDTVGCEFSTLGIFYAIADSATPALFNRKTNDGNLLTWRRDATNVGFVSVASGVVTYGSFVGGHWSQWSVAPVSILPGTVLEVVDDLCEWADEPDQSHLPKVKVSDAPGSAAVYGVFQNYDEDGDIVVASLGALFVRIGAGVIVKRGDLLESAGDGTAHPQADGIMRAATVAKVTSARRLQTYADGSYTVPCTLHCG